MIVTYGQINSNIFGAIYNALVSVGVTPASKNLADLEKAIATVKTNYYNAGVNAGVSTGISYISLLAYTTAGKGTSPFYLNNPAPRTKAFLVVVVSNDGANIAGAIGATPPGGSCAELVALCDGASQYGTINAKIYQLVNLPAGNITIVCSAGGGRMAALFGA